MTPSHSSASSSSRRTQSGISPRPVAADRRTRLRLRELCDEVIASFRVATDRDILTENDRAAARALLQGVGPRR
ncbi:MAG TPA: hypothetical protein VFJ74_10970 [Gemmatimonadaceae bacterium]|nr:hypothetical protein [Gemmatimonadaceae bacterium]